eukprot:6210973-Pleurochrysis_carterae.AAC.4
MSSSTLAGEWADEAAPAPAWFDGIAESDPSSPGPMFGSRSAEHSAARGEVLDSQDETAHARSASSRLMEEARWHKNSVVQIE